MMKTKKRRKEEKKKRKEKEKRKDITTGVRCHDDHDAEGEGEGEGDEGEVCLKRMKGHSLEPTLRHPSQLEQPQPCVDKRKGRTKGCLMVSSWSSSSQVWSFQG